VNRRFRAGELGLAEVERNLAPYRPHVETSPGGASLPVPPGEKPSADLDTLRRDALEALHNYVVAATGHNLARSMTVFRRVLWTLDSHLAPPGERSR
jgi:hypothetical protein